LLKSKGKVSNTKKKEDQNECLSCVDGTWLKSGIKKKSKMYGKDCQKCPVKNCAKCGKLGCIHCKDGFGFFKRKCKACKKDQVYDPFSRRCFVQKENQYLDMHKEDKNKLFAVTDIFGTHDSHTAIFNFNIDWKKVLSTGATITPEHLILNITSITTSLKWLVKEGKKVSEEVVKKETTLLSDLPLHKRRTVYFRMPLMRETDISLIIQPILANPKDFQFYTMTEFKYSLQRHQQGDDNKLDFPEDFEANKQVKSEHMSHKSGFPER